MFQRITYAILTISVCIQISAGQIASFKNNSFTPGDSGFDSGTPASSFFQGYGSSAQLNKEKDFQIRTEPSTFSYQAPLPASGLSTTMSSKDKISLATNPSPVETYVTEFNTAVYTSKTLPDVFDLRELSAEAFSKSLYDYVYAYVSNIAHSDPHYIASITATPFTAEGIDSYTLPVMLDIYGNAIAKYLFAKGTLNSDNAASLARNYAKIVEESAERNWVKETPETKFLALEEGFSKYMESINHLSVFTVEDLATYFTNEVKRVAAKL